MHSTRFISNIYKTSLFYSTGNLESVLINGLNLNNDVVRHSQPHQNLINAPKSFDNLQLDSLICRGKCTIQNVQMVEWMKNSVNVDFNYTIQGQTTLYNAVITNGIVLFGELNGVPFNPNIILQKNGAQTINGNLYIGSSVSNIQNILPVSFDNVQIQYLNSILANDFLRSFSSKALYGSNVIALKSNVQFIQPLVINKLNVDRSFYSANESGFLYQVGADQTIRRHRQMLDGMEMLRQELKEKIGNPSQTSLFSQFSFYKILTPEFIKVLPLKWNGEMVVAVLNSSLNAMGEISFYKWNPAMQALVPNDGRSNT